MLNAVSRLHFGGDPGLPPDRLVHADNLERIDPRKRKITTMTISKVSVRVLSTSWIAS